MISLLLIPSKPARADTVIATIPAGTHPIGVGVNEATNKIYVANFGSSNVTVIDGATNATLTVAAGTAPLAVAVNPRTNKIYVANQDSNNVTVIAGATNATVTVSAGETPRAVAVSPRTNKIYVANTFTGNVTVIDGATNARSAVTAGGIGATGTLHAPAGAPRGTVTTTHDNSWVWAVGNDWLNASHRSVGPDQTLVRERLTRFGDTYWVQSQTNPTPVSGTTVTVNDTAPTADPFNLVLVEIL